VIVLGLHKDPWHSTGAAVIRADGDNVRVASLSQERCDRVKDSRAFPAAATRACLEELDVTSLADVDLVVMDYIRDRDWRRDHAARPCTTDNFLAGLDPGKILVINHHLAHASNTFYASGFEEAAVLVVDGRGSDGETQSLFIGSARGLELVETTDRIGIGLLYAAVTQHLGFGLMQDGKTMGLAPYGAGVPGRIYDFPRGFDGIVTDYGDVCVEGSYALRGDPSPPRTFETRARAAFEVQVECEAAMLHLAAHARARTGLRRLCLAGGVALNSVANYAILRSGLFDDVFITPAASDTGIPLGAALHGYHSVLGRPGGHFEIPPYLGPRQAPDRVRAAVAAFAGYRIVDGDALKTAATFLSANRIVGCFQGRSELGPRALGNRSILMSPLVADNKDVLNARVKRREAFRPYAPLVLEELASDYFLIDRPSPYMLLVPPVREDRRRLVPAVTHVDGTGRLQTLHRDFNPRLYRLVEAFHEATGVPVLLNTSFNVAGEPLVETAEDALRCFVGTDIDALLVDDTLLVKDGRELP
jgi:carbamoyltransferase